MTGVNKSSSLFRSKVRNQVLKNSRKVEYFLKFYTFEKMKHSEYKFLNDIHTDRCQKNERAGRAIRPLNCYGPRDYPWEENTEYCLFEHLYPEMWRSTFVLPRNWLLHYDPSIPILLEYCNSFHYLDLEKQGWGESSVYLIRNRFHLYNVCSDPCSEDLEPHPIRKGDKDWCISYLNLSPPYMSNSYSLYFLSFLLIKNMDFSKFDAHIKAENLICPVYFNYSIEIKDIPQAVIDGFITFNKKFPNCFCVDCRKNYRHFAAYVSLNKDTVKFYLLQATLNEE